MIKLHQVCLMQTFAVFIRGHVCNLGESVHNFQIFNHREISKTAFYIQETYFWIFGTGKLHVNSVDLQGTQEGSVKV